MPEREITPTRVALMDLSEERHLAEEGYELLDEKRILLAAAIRRELARLQTLRADCHRLETEARKALNAALKHNGLDELSVYPPLSTHNDRLLGSRSRLLGLQLISVQWQAGATGSQHPVIPSPEATACAGAYRSCIKAFAELAACSVNLRRLTREFVRTERRARAIENILLPEIASSIRTVEEALELLDQEEIARVRSRGRGRA